MSGLAPSSLMKLESRKKDAFQYNRIVKFVVLFSDRSSRQEGVTWNFWTRNRQPESSRATSIHPRVRPFKDEGGAQGALPHGGNLSCGRPARSSYLPMTLAMIGRKRTRADESERNDLSLQDERVIEAIRASAVPFHSVG